MHGESDNQFKSDPPTVVPQKGCFVFSCFGCAVTIIISFLLLIITISVYVYWSGQSNLENEKNNIESYCLEHYGKKVIVDSIEHVNRWSPDAPSYFLAKVHPEEDPELHVEFTRGDYSADPKKLRYNERFLSEYWSKQELIILNEYLQLHGINITKASFSFNLPDEVKGIIKGTTPSIAEMMRKYQSSMECRLLIEVDEGLNIETSVENQAEQIWKIMDFLKENINLENYEFSYDVYTMKNNERRFLYSLDISFQQIKTINSADDVALLLRETIQKQKVKR